MTDSLLDVLADTASAVHSTNESSTSNLASSSKRLSGKLQYLIDAAKVRQRAEQLQNEQIDLTSSSFALDDDGDDNDVEMATNGETKNKNDDGGGDNRMERPTERKERIYAEARTIAYAVNDEGSDNDDLIQY